MDDFVEKLKNFVKFIPVCPEVEIGLDVPRNPVRLVKDKQGHARMVQPATDQDVTENMTTFSHHFLSSLENVDGFILKHRSPSCGPGDVKLYVGAHQATTHGKTQGLFAHHVSAMFPYHPLEDEGRLKNFKLREYFLTRIYTFSRFRRVKEKRQIHALTQFHAAHKYLFMAYDQHLMRELGNIAANPEQRDVKTVLQHYEAKMQVLLSNDPTRKSIINVLYHLQGYFSETTSPQESKFFEESIQMYRDKRIPLSSVIMIIHSWALREQQDYLLNQVFLQPFPQELIELKDSGRELRL